VRLSFDPGIGHLRYVPRPRTSARTIVRTDVTATSPSNVTLVRSQSPGRWHPRHPHPNERHPGTYCRHFGLVDVANCCPKAKMGDAADSGTAPPDDAKSRKLVPQRRWSTKSLVSGFSSIIGLRISWTNGRPLRSGAGEPDAQVGPTGSNSLRGPRGQAPAEVAATGTAPPVASSETCT